VRYSFFNSKIRANKKKKRAEGHLRREMQEARKSRYYGDIRYKPGAAATITTIALTPASALEEKEFPPEPAGSTVAPAEADSISDS
jgi:hypothetical protein